MNFFWGGDFTNNCIWMWSTKNKNKQKQNYGQLIFFYSLKYTIVNDAYTELEQILGQKKNPPPKKNSKKSREVIKYPFIVLLSPLPIKNKKSNSNGCKIHILPTTNEFVRQI
jgi:hypothetical protein